METQGKHQHHFTAADDAVASPSPLQSFFVHLSGVLGLALAFWVARNVYSINLISDPSQTLFLLWVIEAPTVILIFSLFRENPKECSFRKAVGRGVCALIPGALVIALGAIALGAPVGTKYFQQTINWSLVMSLFTFVPAASVFGSSWADWRRIFLQAETRSSIDDILFYPAHGAVIGAWFGCWPMPLDWERPWQEWPICVTYGAIAGYVIAMVASMGYILLRRRQGKHFKGE